MKKIAGNVYFIQGNNRGAFPFSNSMLIRDKQTVLFDTGIGIERLKELRDMVDVVITSHLHPDHMSGNWVFKGRRIMISEMEVNQCDLEILSKRYVSEELQKDWIDFVRKTTGYRDFQPTESFSEGDTLIFGETEVIPLYLPGHTKAHFGFYISDMDLVFGGDIDLTSFGPWYGHEESSVDEFIQSINKLMKLNPRIYLSGHKPPVSGQDKVSEELEKYLDVIWERENRILSLLSVPRSIEDLVLKSPIYRKKPYLKEFLDYWEGKMILHHMKGFQKEGMVRKITDDSGNELFLASR